MEWLQYSPLVLHTHTRTDGMSGWDGWDDGMGLRGTTKADSQRRSADERESSIG